MNREPEFTAKPPEGEGGLLSLAILSLLAGAVAGLIGGIFRLSLDQADRFREALIAWVHGEKLAGFLLVAATCTAAAAGPADAARNLRRRDRFRSTPSHGRTDALHRRLVAAFRRSGGARHFQHRPRAANNGVLDSRAAFPRTGAPAKADLLAHAGRRVAATARVGGRAPGPAACGSADRPARWVRDVSSGFRPGDLSSSRLARTASLTGVLRG